MRTSKKQKYAHCISWARVRRGKWESRLFKIMYNNSWKIPYKFYVGTRLIGEIPDRKTAFKTLIHGVESYTENDWEIESLHIQSII